MGPVFAFWRTPPPSLVYEVSAAVVSSDDTLSTAWPFKLYEVSAAAVFVRPYASHRVELYYYFKVKKEEFQYHTH